MAGPEKAVSRHSSGSLRQHPGGLKEKIWGGLANGGLSMQPGRLKVAMTSVIAALLVGALLLSVPVGSIAGRNNPSHFTETYLGGRSIKLFTGTKSHLMVKWDVLDAKRE